MSAMCQLGLLGVLAFGIAGCGEVTTDNGSVSDISEIKIPEDGDTGSSGAVAGLTGEVEIDGSSTVFPISEAAADQFRKTYPEVKVTVGVSGTGGGFKRFSKGETNISEASRPIKHGELEQCQAANVEFVELPVAYDGLTIVVNPVNDWAEELSIDNLKKIFGGEGTAAKWSDVNPDWPDSEIKIYAPGTDSGTFDYFKEVVAGKEGSLCSDMSVSEDDNALVTGVAGQREAIGFFGAAYYFENKDKLKAVKITNPSTGGGVQPTPETIESGEYAPFSRPLFIYVNSASLRRPEMKKFVMYYLDNAASFAKTVGYVALPSEVYQRAKKHLTDRLAGTHYLTGEGEKRLGALPDVYKVENLVK
ncbi:MAG: phosphate-binding protein [Planctomycetaceae bacterium]|nr:phosphate-binding protein [Planctomycetaceae bacterium]